MNIKDIYFEEINSTSTYIKDNFNILDDFTFVSTSFQSNGRGRSSRVWYSNKNENIMFSFLIKDEILINKYKDLSLSSAYVIANLFNKLYPRLKIEIKWPNDVYVNNKKILGILLEGHSKGNKLDGVIIGIGINCNQIIFPNSLIYPVTSLKIELNYDINIIDLKNKIEEEIVNYFNLLKKDENEHIIYSREHNYLKNKEVYATINNEKKLIKVLDINDDCSLKILVDNEIRNIISGEITFH